jgi:serine/threonine-protein kinase
MSMHAHDQSQVRARSEILHDPLPGTGYRTLRRIGAGLSSEVFEAVDRDGVHRAVKVLRSFFVSSPEAVFRLEQEGLALSTLNHPNLVPVLDVGTTAAGRPFFVMPLLDGATVRRRLHKRGRFAPATACAIVAEMLTGLDAAHRAGIVHRDVKPANVFLPRRRVLTRAPRCLVLDFGIAKLLDGSGRATTESRIVGAPRYLAPEQILGGRVDARTDVYGAALTLFEMISGQSPFEATGTIELMRAHVDEKPTNLQKLAPVSNELWHAIERALAKEPARRWPSARAFASVLERAAACERRRVEEEIVIEIEILPESGR